jgi:hypothetical protein
MEAAMTQSPFVPQGGPIPQVPADADDEADRSQDAGTKRDFSPLGGVPTPEHRDDDGELVGSSDADEDARSAGGHR